MSRKHSPLCPQLEAIDTIQNAISDAMEPRIKLQDVISPALVETAKRAESIALASLKSETLSISMIPAGIEAAVNQMRLSIPDIVSPAQATLYSSMEQLYQKTSPYLAQEVQAARLAASLRPMFDEMEKTTLLLQQAGLNAVNNFAFLQEYAFASIGQDVIDAVTRNLSTVFTDTLLPVFEEVRRIPSYTKRAYRFYVSVLFNHTWYPYVSDLGSVSLMNRILAICRCTHPRSESRTSNRARKIDKEIFSYFSKPVLNDMLKDWLDSPLPKTQKRLLKEAISHYHSKQYGSAYIVLASLWEDLIARAKGMPGEHRQRVKQDIEEMAVICDIPETHISFLKEFVFYDCRKEADIKPDAPGRHSAAHGWHKDYPTRKVALNAILVTANFISLVCIADELAG